MKLKDSLPRPRGRPNTGAALSAAERMRRMRARRKEAGMTAKTAWVYSPSTPSEYSSHRLADARSLAIHVVLAEQALKDPALVNRAKALLARWERQQQPHIAPWLKEWQNLVRRPVGELLATMTALTEDGARLRQSSPFSPLLDAAHRKRIHEALRP